MRRTFLPSALLFCLGLLAPLLTSSLRAEDVAPNPRATRAKEAAAARMAYASSPDYNPYDTTAGDAAQAIGQRLKKGEFAAAIAEATVALEKAPYDINLLMSLSAAYRGAGDTAKSDATRARWIALIDSIVDSGDGRSFGTAFKVISVHEEYAVIRALNLQPTGQALQTHNGEAFDVMKVKAPKLEQEFELYFNVNLPHSWLQRELGAVK